MKKNVRLILVTVTACIMAFVYAPVQAVVPVVTTETNEETAIKLAVEEFKNLSKKEKNARFKEAKKVIKQLKADKKTGKASGNANVLAIIFAVLIPPVGVLIYENKVTTKFWISLLLTLLFWLPGAIYSVLVVTGNA